MTMGKRKPTIGLTVEWNEPLASYILRQNYCRCIEEAGGLPFLLPYHLSDAEHYADFLDGLIVTGGDIDVDPKLYGETIQHKRVEIQPQRTSFEYAVLEEMLARDKAVLGICGGMQLLNVVLGGSLIQHVEDVVGTTIAHEQPNPRHEVGHRIIITAETLLSRLVHKDEMHINSAHHQAVKKVGAGVIVSAHTDDGVIEAIESVQHRFCLGVQWHPEYRVDQADMLVFSGFIRSASS